MGNKKCFLVVATVLWIMQNAHYTQGHNQPSYNLTIHELFGQIEKRDGSSNFQRKYQQVLCSTENPFFLESKYLTK